jgi:hypothetical protein
MRSSLRKNPSAMEQVQLSCSGIGYRQSASDALHESSGTVDSEQVFDSIQEHPGLIKRFWAIVEQVIKK